MGMAWLTLVMVTVNLVGVFLEFRRLAAIGRRLDSLEKRYPGRIL